MDISRQNYFEVFSLPVSFHLENQSLVKAYRELQSQYHPDRHSGGSDAERRQAQQLTSILNEAYETLRSPLKRAGYLLQLKGIDPEENNQSHLGNEFLLQQMELREALEQLVAAEDAEGLERLKKEVTGLQQQQLQSFAQAFEAGQYAESKPVYNKLQFLFKLLSEIDQAEEKLLDY